METDAKTQASSKTDAELVAEFWNAHSEALFDQKPIAKVRGCSEALLERERWEGRGPPFLKIGRSVRYKKSTVISWLSTHQAFQSTSEYAKQTSGRQVDVPAAAT